MRKINKNLALNSSENSAKKSNKNSSENLREIPHTPVLLSEVLEAFKGLEKGVFLDATLGFGGHSEALLNAHKALKFIVCDQDDDALNFSKKRLAKFSSRVEFHKSNFADILANIDTSGLCGVLADLGVSSWQLDSDERGFSVNSGFLDMRMDKNAEFSAFEIVNFAPESELARIFTEFGELKDGKNLAAKICTERKKGEIRSAKALANIIGRGKVLGRSVSRAILAFQALRIAVNDELNALQKFLNALEALKPPKCVVAVICFHSLEDRLVKIAFRKWAKSCICDEKALRCVCGNSHNLGKILTKKPLTPGASECAANSRAKCAKMRLFGFK